jgi:hypothetical protein
LEEDKGNYKLETKSTPAQIAEREKIADLFRSRPMPDDHLLVSLGLYMRSSALIKILFINELYEQVSRIPGVIVEFGVWWGQNLALFENLRAIYEPFNQTRRVIGFDTFAGYDGFSTNDQPTSTDGFTSFSEVVTEGGYSVSENYKDYLDSLLSAHEGTNVLGNLKRHTLVEGNVVKTAPEYFEKHPETIVALAYFDLALYEPTKTCLETLLPHLVPGSIIVMDELNFPEAPGETIAFKEVFADRPYKIRKSRLIPDKSIITIV